MNDIFFLSLEHIEYVFIYPLRHEHYASQSQRLVNTVGVNSDFSFSWTSFHPQTKDPSRKKRITHNRGENTVINNFSNYINTK